MQNPDTLNNGQTFRTCSSSAFRIIDNSSFAINGQHEVFVRADSTQGWGTSTAYNLRSGWQNISSLLSLGWNQVRVRVQLSSNPTNYSNFFFLIEVLPSPIVTLSPIPSVCQNEGNFDLNQFASPAGGTFNGSPWVSANGQINLNGTVPAGNHTIWYRYKAGNECADSVSRNWTILSKPSLNISANGNQISLNGITTYSVCTPNTTTSFFFSFTGSINYNSYTIDFGDGNTTSGGTLPSAPLSHLYSAPGLYPVILTGTNSNGCQEQIRINVFFGTNPQVTLPNPGSMTLQCLNPNGVTYSFDINGVSANPSGTVYTVEFNDGSQDLVYSHPPPANFSHTFSMTSCGFMTPSFNNSFFIKITASNPCGASSSTIDPINFSQPPLAGLSGPSSTCADSIISIVNSSSSGENVQFDFGSQDYTCSRDCTIVWEVTPNTYTLHNGSAEGFRGIPTDPNSWIGGSSSFDISFDVGGNYSISQFIAGSPNCPIDSAEIVICAEEPPNASFQKSKEHLCTPEWLILDNTGRDTGFCSNYSFEFIIQNAATGAIVDTLINPTDSFRFLPIHTEGKYLITFRKSNGCGESFAYDTVDVVHSPVVGLPPDSSFCGLHIIDFSDPYWLPLYEEQGGDTLSYAWQISPTTGFQFTNGTNASSRHPIISFNQFGQYDISLEFFNECSSDQDNLRLVFYDEPVPIGAADTLICFNDNFSFSVSGSIGAAPYQFQWFNNQGTLVGTGPNFSRSNCTSDSVYTLRIIDNLNCFTDSTFTVFVNDSAYILIDTTQAVTCEGVSLGLSSQASGGTGPYSFNWTPGSLLNDSTIANPNFMNPLQNQWFSVQTVDVIGCEAYDSIFVTVNPLPSTNLPSSQLVCIGDSVQIGQTDTSFYNYLWTSTPAGFSSTQGRPSVSPNDTTRYHLRMTNSITNCVDTFSIVVYPIALPEASFQGTPLTGCSPLNLSLSNNSSVSTGLQWSVNDSLFSSSTNPNLVLLNPFNDRDTTYSIKLDVIAGNGCSDDTTQSVTVLPVPLISISPTDSGLCSGGSGTIINTSIAKTPATYNWSSSSPLITFNNNSISEPQYFTGNYSGQQDTIVWIELLLSSIDGCTAVDSLPITIFASPTVQFSLPAPDCAPFTLNPVDSSFSAGDSLYYSWSISPNIGVGQLYTNTDTPQFTLPSSALGSLNYQVTLLLSDERSCTQLLSQAFTLRPKPQAAFLLPADSCGPFSFTPQNLSSNGLNASDTSGLHYIWSSSSGFTSTAFEPIFTFPSAIGRDTVYAVSVIVQNEFNCSDTLQDSIAIHPDPIAQFISGPSVDCSPFLLDSNVVNAVQYPNSNSTYTWQLLSSDNSNILQTFLGRNSVSYTIANDGDTVIIRLIVDNQFGCNPDTLEQLFYTIENPLPGFVLSADSGCHPMSVLITDTSTNGVNHEWFINGQSFSTAQNPSFTLINNSFTLDSLYNVKLVITAGASGCKDSTEQIVTVLPKPFANFSINSFSCPSDTLNILNLSEVKATSTYLWSASSRFISFSDTSSPAPQLYIPDLQTGSDSTFDITLQVYSPDGCSDDTTVSITVFSRPKAQLNSTSSACGPFTIFPIDSSTSVSGVLNYQWTISPLIGVVSTGTSLPNPQFDLPVSVTDSVVYTIRLTVTDDRGCIDSTNKRVVVYGKPMAAAQATPRDSCGPFTVTWSNLSQSAYPSQSLTDMNFFWNLGNGDTSSAIEPTTTYNSAAFNDTIYFMEMRVVDALGCGDTIRDSLTVYPNPIAQITPGPTVDCSPFIIDSAIVQPILYSNANDTYSWQILSADTNTVLHSFSGPFSVNDTIRSDGDSIIIRLITSNIHGCKPDTVHQLFYTIENPIPGFVASVDSGCHPLNVQLTDTSTTGVTHEWFVNGRSVSTAQNPLINLTNTSNTSDSIRTIKLVITAGASGCKDSTELDVLVYPQPFAAFNLQASSCPSDTISLADQSVSKAATLYTWTSNSPLITFSDSTSPTPQVFIGDLQTGSDSIVTLGLYLSSPDGCVDDTLVDITIYSRPEASFSLSGRDCGPVQLLPSDSSVGPGLSYSWSIQPNMSVVSSGLTTSSPIFDLPVSINDSVNYRISVIVTDARGCSDTLSKRFTLYPKPTADFTLNLRDSCGVFSPLITNNSTPNQVGLNQSDMTFSWDLGNGDSASVLFPTPSYQAAFSRDTSYLITMVATNVYGCSDTVADTVTVYPDPIAQLQYTATVDCAPFVIDSTVVSADLFSQANDQYLWKILTVGLDSVMATYTGPSSLSHIIADDGDSIIVRLIASNVHECNLDSIDQLFYTIENPTPGFVLSTDSACHPLSLQVTDTSTSGVSHEWFINGTSVSTVQNPSFTLTNNSNTLDSAYSIKLVITAGASGCKDSTEQTVVVHPVPIASFIMTGSTCPSDTLVIVDNSLVKGNGTYRWRTSSSFITMNDTTLANPQLYIPDLQTGSDSIIDIQLRVLSEDNCVDDTTISLVIYSRPEAIFSIPNASCSPDVLAPSDSSMSADGSALTYLWSILPNLPSAGINSANPTFNIPLTQSDSVNYVVRLQVIDGRGCIDSISSVYTALPKPIAGFTSTPSDSCGPLTVSFLNTSATGQTGQDTSALSHMWLFGDGFTSTLDHPRHQFAASILNDTTYVVELQTQNAFGCYDTLRSNITVYPDPIAQMNAVATVDCAPFSIDSTVVTSTLFSITNDQYIWEVRQISDSSLISAFNGRNALDYTIIPDGDSVLVYLITSNVHGCKADTSIQLFYTIENPEPGFILSLDSGCHPLNIQVTDTSTSGVSHEWFLNGTLFSTSQNPSLNLVNNSYVNDSIYELKLVITAGLSGCKDSVEQLIPVHPKPSAIIALNTLASCPLDTIPISSTSLVKGPAVYQWSSNSTLIQFLNDSAQNTSFYFADWHTGQDTTVSIDLNVVSSDGCVHDTSVSFTIYSRPVASFTLPPANCAPLFIYPLDSSVTAGNSLAYSWDIAPRATGGNLNSSLPNFDIPVSFQDSIIYTIYLVITDDRGCVDSTTRTVTSYPRPTSNFFVSPTDSCGPLTLQFTNASNSGQTGMGTNTMNFLWDFGNGDTSNAIFPQSTFQQVLERDTTYSVSLITTNAFGCEDTSFRNITIFPDPISQYTATTTLECAPFLIDTNIVSVTDYPLANDTYIWEVFDLNSNGILLSSVGINSLNYTILNDDDSVGIRLISQNIHNCIPDTAVLQFRTLPDPVASFGLSSYATCHPASIQVFDSSTTGVTYEWFVNGILSSTLANPLFSLTNTSTLQDSLFIIELVVTAGTGCTDTLKDTVVVFALPDPNFNATEVCQNFTSTFTDLSTTIDSLVSWNWTFGDGDSSQLPNPVHVYDTFGVYNVILEVTDTRGCSQTYSDSVIVRPNPSVDFELLHACYPDSLCLGSVINLNDSTFLPLLGQPITQWQWDIDADGTIEYTAQFPQHSFNALGSIDIALYVTTAFGCTDTSIKTYNVVDTPTAQFSMDSARGCGPLNVQFTNNSTGYINSYYWRFFARDTLGNDILMFTDSTDNPNPVPGFVQSFLQDTTYYIELTVSNCCGTNSYLDSVLVYSSPVAYFLAAPDSGCSPLPVTFMLDGFVRGNPDYLTFDWGDGNPIDTLNWQWLIQPSGDTLWYWGQQNHTFLYGGRQADTSYFVTLTAYNQCGDSSYTYPIVVRPNSVQAFFLSTPSAGCAPLTVNFNDFSFGGTNITWCFDYDAATNNCGPFTAGGPSVSHTYQQGGTYTVAQIVDDGCSVDTAFQQIVVYPAPDALFQFSHSGCLSDTVVFENLSTVDSGSINLYIWYFGDGDSSLATEPRHFYTSGGTYQVCLRTRTNYGCWDEYCDSITINSNPIVQFSGQNLCLNEQPVVFNNISTPGSGTFNSTFWDFGDGNTSTQIQPSHTYAQAGVYTVRLTHENSFGCWDSSQVQVTIDSIPTSSFNSVLIAGDSCDIPQTYQFNNSSTGAQGYIWDFDYLNAPGQWTSTLVNPVFTYTSTGIYTVALFSFNSVNCTDTMFMTIEVKPVPTIFIRADQYEGCSPLTVQFRDSLVYNWPIPITISSYTWYFGDGQSSNLQFPVHTYQTSGIYDVRLVITTNDGCTDSIIVNSLIEVTETPHPSFDITPTTGSAFQFTNTSSQTSPSVFYNWHFGDGEFSTQESPWHDYDVDLYDNNYSFEVCLTVINNNGCDSTVCDSVNIIGYRLNVPNALTPELSYSDYGDAVHFLPKGYGLRSYELEIFDGWGNRIFRSTKLDEEGIPTEAWNGRRNNEGEILPMGAYVWTIKAVFENGMHWRGKEYESGRVETYGSVTLIR